MLKCKTKNSRTIFSKKLIRPTIQDYLELNDLWHKFTTYEKEEFYLDREQLIKKYAGAYYKDGTLLNSSGSATGLAKQYLFGPNWQNAAQFHEHLCFGDLKYDTTILLNILPTEHHYFYKGQINSHYGDPNKKICAINASSDAASIIKINKTIKEISDKPVIIRIIPTQAEILIKKNIIFYEKIENAYFTSTGEVCVSLVKKYFKDKIGLLRDTMKIWNGGASFFTCPYGNTHWNHCVARILIKNKQLYSSDLFNLSQYFLDYCTDDNLEITKKEMCNCGLVIEENNWQEKLTTIELDDNFYDFLTLKSDFIRASKANPENLIGINFGVGKNKIIIFCEIIQNIYNFDEIRKQLEKKWKTQVDVQEGLKYNNYKTKKMFLLD